MAGRLIWTMATAMACEEQRRQDALLRTLWAFPAPSTQAKEAPSDAPTEASPDPDLKLHPDTLSGLQAYRRHAQAVARRALAHAHPTVSAMLGDEAMGQLGWLLWRHQPPLRGDLGEWGEGLAALMAGALAPQSGAAEMLGPWPWLADVARLDWARHRCERLAARPLDADSLSLLSDADPDEVILVLQDHVLMLDTDWPVDALWRAHQLPADQQVAAAEAVLRAHGAQAAGLTTADRCRKPQTMLLWWSAAPASPEAPGVQHRLLPPEQADWLRSVQAMSLGAALEQAPTGVDFSAWLQDALRHGWLLGARMRPAS
jgi:hypothetical protein